MKSRLVHETEYEYMEKNYTVPNYSFPFTCAASALNRPESLSSIYNHSVDLKETAEAHLACSCNAQCA